MERLGRYLRTCREEKGIFLEDIGRVTKINLSYLKDMEEERFDRLPAPIFVIGFLRQYAQCIGLDPEDVVLRYRLTTQKDPGAPREGTSERSWKGKRRSLWIMGGCVCGLILLWLFLYPGTKNGGEKVRSIRLPRSTSEELKKEALKRELDLQSGPSGGTIPQNGSSHTGKGRTSSPTKGETSFRDVPVSVTIQALRKTWVQVTIDDKEPDQRFMKTGDRYSFQADRNIRLKIGNGNGVRIFYNGKVYEKLGQKGEVVHIVFPPPES